MEHHIATPANRLRSADPSQTARSKDHDELEMSRWEDDSGAIISELRRSPVLIADCHRAEAA